MSHGNGHAPGVRSSASGEVRKARPNILIIHDGEREQRLKGGPSCPANSEGSSPRSPSGFSSLGEQSSHHTETTTLAEVACHRSSLGSSSPGGGGHPTGDGSAKGAAERTEVVMTNGNCLLPGPRRDPSVSGSRGNARDSVGIAGQAVVYRRSASAGASPEESGLATAPSLVSGTTPRGTANGGDERSDQPRGKRQGGAVNGRLKSRGVPPGAEENVRLGGQRSAASEGNVSQGRLVEGEEAARVTGSSSFHGFTKRKSAKTPSHYTAAAQRKEYVCASYNPRRNSYAAAIANPAWVDVPPVRRHSDEPRHVTNASSSQLYVKNARTRHYSCEGADNPAYEAADDNGSVRM